MKSQVTALCLKDEIRLSYVLTARGISIITFFPLLRQIPAYNIKVPIAQGIYINLFINTNHNNPPPPEKTHRIPDHIVFRKKRKKQNNVPAPIYLFITKKHTVFQLLLQQLAVS